MRINYFLYYIDFVIQTIYSEQVLYMYDKQDNVALIKGLYHVKYK